MSKLTLMVCPHDTAKKPERWFRFVQYLNHHLTVGVHLEISLDFNDMDTDAVGQDVLQDLHIEQWRTTMQEEIDQMQRLLRM